VAALKTNLEYGRVGRERLYLDAFVPEGAGPFPAVVLVHGGGWTGGDKSGGPLKGYMLPMHEPLLQAGFAVFSVNYRLAPQHPYPACIEDVEAAIRWVKAHAAESKVDTARIALAGESSGGHLVALAAVRADASTRVAAVAAFYGIFGFLGEQPANGVLHPNIAALIGRATYDDAARKILASASPLLAVKAGLPPFLLVHGTADFTVPYSQSVAMQTRLREAGVACELLTIENGAHGMINWDATAPDYKAKVVAWLRRTLAQDRQTPADPLLK
jgi:acetyl esterase/lipase